MALTNGMVSFRAGQGQGSWLGEFNGYAVTSLTEERPWQVRATPNGHCDGFTLTYDGKDDMALTLGEAEGEYPNEITIIIKPLDDPPSRKQVWTYEDSITLLIDPPRVTGWLQSCDRPDMSVSVGGHVPLPRIFLPVSAVPNQQARENPDASRWSANYKA